MTFGRRNTNELVAEDAPPAAVAIAPASAPMGVGDKASARAGVPQPVVMPTLNSLRVDPNASSHAQRVIAQREASKKGRGKWPQIANDASGQRKPDPIPLPRPAALVIGPLSERLEAVRKRIQPPLIDRLDTTKAAALSAERLGIELASLLADLLEEQKIVLNASEQTELVNNLLADMVGLGPLEPLLADESVTDILVNGPKQIYVERAGRLELSDASFRDDDHVLNLAIRMVTRVGRRIDESSPVCDARLADGSRVNIVIPPLAVDGPTISIRKFPKMGISLLDMVEQGNISREIAVVVSTAVRSRLNILVSGGTGSGKTTLLNALSQMIGERERLVTIEDAAELRLRQPHVVRLETRPANLEGKGEFSIRDLVKNALRMRPDRIILGEARGEEALDMLQAMNTGHDGSLSTIHASGPREALQRFENMVWMAGLNSPTRALRTQIASAVDLILQLSRMHDGVRRVTHVTEVIGMEGDNVITRDLFALEVTGERPDGRYITRYKISNETPRFMVGGGMPSQGGQMTFRRATKLFVNEGGATEAPKLALPVAPPPPPVAAPEPQPQPAAPARVEASAPANGAASAQAAPANGAVAAAHGAGADAVQGDGTVQRASPRRKVLLGARLWHASGYFVVECMVYDLSEHGAKIRLEGEAYVPDDLVLKLRGVPERKCKLVWRRGNLIGVKFS